MNRNIYDDPAFFDGYSRLSRSVHGLDGAPEWPALRALLPDLRGLNVLDLGCGYGWFSRWAAEHGAASVLGLDLSVRMLERATSSAAHPAITYRRADLETVELPADAFDLAYSSLAFHYLEHLDTLLRTLHRALVPGGRLVFSIEHPIYTAPRQPGFVVDADGHRSWPVDGYQREGPRVTDWLAPGVVKQHRTLGTLVNLLIASGFTLTHLDEWGPTPEQVDAQPALDEERDRPMMAIFAARR
ncbi:SAM-dependent methyltransferase [Burkholderia pseudomultivorans]|uniref:class I SAM-dependent methyltransferase n=1 Tax=Burkholderia pseudomultivorans TaxID=1207504 RepID=UPI00075B0611|nr:class I SAM-dependent methyltransferase [Burkholderia pseudomultivorans]KWI55401.1 SAM-dependent methyltransferase [Burkholderia pseudomultivorans]